MRERKGTMAQGRMRDDLLAAGINTGNSLDGADAVVSRFGQDGSISDLVSFSQPYPEGLAERMRTFRSFLQTAHGDVSQAAVDWQTRGGSLDRLLADYTTFIAGCLEVLIERFRRVSAEPLDVIGFHGQAVAHLPPSLAGGDDPSQTYTCQLGDGQAVADRIGIPVVYDFRSDDVMNGGEGAPLAPRHHWHLAQLARRQGHFPLAFINGGNTANFSFITTDESTGQPVTRGWDAGPLNAFPDQLMRRERGLPCDEDGRVGRTGTVSAPLLRKLFDTSAVTEKGENFFLRMPPKSSDPQWYRWPALSERGADLRFEDCVRTVEYFGAYVCYLALTQLPTALQMPRHFVLCGGGWKNPVTRTHFTQLLKGQWDQGPVLPEHVDAFAQVQSRLHTGGAAPVVNFSEAYGFDGTAMEARLFADAAVCRVRGEPFTSPETTGVRTPTVCGLLRFPHGDERRASPTLVAWLHRYQSRGATLDEPTVFDPRWSRASRGWYARKMSVQSRHDG